MCPNKISSFSTFPGSVKYVEKGGKGKEEGGVGRRKGWGGGRGREHVGSKKGGKREL